MHSHLALCPGGPHNELKVVQRAFELLVKLNVTILRQFVRHVADGTVQSHGLHVHKFHVAIALTTPKNNHWPSFHIHSYSSLTMAAHSRSLVTIVCIMLYTKLRKSYQYSHTVTFTDHLD